MSAFKIDDVVEIHSTTEKSLDGQTGSVIGFYGSGPEAYPIILFTQPVPIGYNPAIVMTPYCLKKV